MKTSVLLAATAVLGLWGCAHSGTGGSGGEVWRPMTEKEIARQSRLGAPTVYDGEATGGAGFTVTNSKGETWTPELAPGNTVTRTASDDPPSRGLSARASAEKSGRSVVIDEGRTPRE